MIENKIGIVVLARLSSTRLPGKALKKIMGKPVLSYIIERLERVVPRPQFILATSTEPSDDAIAHFARQNGIKCYRGSLENVAQRFIEAAKELNCTYACRINGDNIFLDTEVLKSLLDVALTGKYQFLSNVKDRTYPKGMSVEIVKVSYFTENSPVIYSDAYYQEHVLVYFYSNEAGNTHFYLKNTRLPEAAGLQMALDTPEDFKRSQWILEHLTVPHYEAGMAKILKQNSKYEKLL